MLKFVGRLLLFNLLFYVSVAILAVDDWYRSSPGTSHPMVAVFLYSAFIWFNIVYLVIDGIGLATGVLRSPRMTVNLMFPIVSYVAIAICVIVISMTTG